MSVSCQPQFPPFYTEGDANEANKGGRRGGRHVCVCVCMYVCVEGWGGVAPPS